MSEEQGLTPYETREILFYKTENGEVRVEILLFQENLWLTQAKMAELFEVQKAAISKHLKNIFESGELSEDSVVSKMETTAADGKRYQTNYYNLDAIIAVGYRVSSKKATMLLGILKYNNKCLLFTKCISCFLMGQQRNLLPFSMMTVLRGFVPAGLS